MKKGILFFALAVFCFFFTIDAVFAQRGRSQGGGADVSMRIASPLPRNSDWGRALDRLAADWTRITNNEIRAQVLHQQEGGEARMLSSLRSNNIQAALFVSTGLSEICPAVLTLSVPFYIRNDDELDLVIKEAMPYLNAQVHNDFVIIAWAKGGWVNIFSRDPVLTPDDLRRHKIGTSPELREVNTVFSTMGFNVEETDMVSLGTKLNSNVINAIYLIPAAVAPMGLQKNLKNMMETPIAPVMGGIVINRVTWDKLGQNRQQELIRSTQQIAGEFDTITPRINANAVTTLSRDGLTVNKLSPAQEDLWRAEWVRAMPSLLGTAFDRDLYQRIGGILEKSRSGQ